MKSQAYFEKIHKHIEANLKTADSSIRLAVAWFTDSKLFDLICEKAKAGIVVELLIANHEINVESRLDFQKLKDNGGKIYWIGEGRMYDPLMHNKFCIIDNHILITGSYNWTQRAKSNHESITVIEDDPNLILDFNQEFDKIKDKYYNKKIESIDWTKVIIRLDTLLNVIRLEDEEDIKYQIEKTKSLIPKNFTDERIDKLKAVLMLCNNKDYIKAVGLLQAFTSEFKKITFYKDPEISALQLEIRSLEYQISSLEDEKTDITKNIRSFELKYNEELGYIINEILHLKKIIAEKLAEEFEDDQQKQEEYQEAKSDYDDFSKSYQEKLSEPKPFELDFNKQAELKKNYRKASKLCHPDKVTEEQKELATKVFTELKNAYDQNDLAKVNEILASLEKGIFKSQGETITQKDKLTIIRENLIRKRNELEEILQLIKNTDAFSKIKIIDNWDEYFNTTKEEFERILEELKTETTV